MSIFITLIAALIVFSAVIAIHEFGHFAVAKLCGIQVNEFSIGMGPTLWKKAHKGTQQGVPQGVCRGVRRAEIVGHGSVLSSVKICKEYSPFIRAIQAAEKSPLTAEGAGNEKIRAMQELLLPASQPAEHDLCRSSA